MKKLIVAFGLLMVMSSCNQSKIAYVNVEEVIKEYEGSKNAENIMREKSQSISGDLDRLAQEFQVKVQAYQQTSGKLSANDRAQKEQELMQEQQMIQQRQQMAQQQVQQEGQKIIEEIDNEIKDFIEEYAVSNGYTYVLGTSSQTKSVLYGKEALNITDDVIDALNVAYVPVDEKPKTEEKTEEVPVN
mgnify:CR=1 FL=1